MSELADFRLSPRARATLSALAPIVLTDEVDELGVRDDVVNGVELFLRSIPTPIRLGIVAGLATFEQSARAHPTSFGRGFSKLSQAKAEAHFERYWESSLGALKQLARALKMFLTMSYYEHPKKKAQLRYTPEAWIAKVSQERRERFADEIREAEAAVLAPSPVRAELAAGVAAREAARAAAGGVTA